MIFILTITAFRVPRSHEVAEGKFRRIGSYNVSITYTHQPLNPIPLDRKSQGWE